MEVETFPRRQLQLGGGLGRQRRTFHGKDELRVKNINPYRQEDGTLYPRIYHGYGQPSSQCQVQCSPMFTVLHNPKKSHLDAHAITAVAIRREREGAPGTYVSAVSSVFSTFSTFNQARAVEETSFVHVQIKAIYDTILAAYNASNYMKFHGCRAIVIQIDQEMEWIAKVLCRFHEITEKASYDEVKLHQLLRYPDLLTQLNGLIEGFEATTMLRVQFLPIMREELGFAYQLAEKALDLHLMPTMPYDETLFDASDYDGSDYSIEDEELIECVNACEDDSHLIEIEPEDGDDSVDVKLVMDLGQQQQVLVHGQSQVHVQQRGSVVGGANVDVENATIGGITVVTEKPGFALPSPNGNITNVQQDNIERQTQSAGTTTVNANANSTINDVGKTAGTSKATDLTLAVEPITPPNNSATITTPPPLTPLKIDNAMSTPMLVTNVASVTQQQPKPTLSPVSISVSDVLPRSWRLPSLPDFDSLPFSYSPTKKPKLDTDSLAEPNGLLPSPLPRPSTGPATTQMQSPNTLLGGIAGLVSAMKNGSLTAGGGGGGLLGELGKGGRIGLR